MNFVMYGEDNPIINLEHCIGIQSFSIRNKETKRREILIVFFMRGDSYSLPEIETQDDLKKITEHFWWYFQDKDEGGSVFFDLRKKFEFKHLYTD